MLKINMDEYGDKAIREANKIINSCHRIKKRVIGLISTFIVSSALLLIALKFI